MLIRPATDADWPAIWPFFHTIVAAGDSFCYPLDLDYEQGREDWMLADPDHTVVAVNDGGTILGSANVHCNRPGNGAHVASGNYMVDPAHTRQGVGRALCEYTVEWARVVGYRAMQFNAIVETNVAAVRLYREVGFEVVGTVPEAFHHPRDGYVGLHVMHRRL